MVCMGQCGWAVVDVGVGVDEGWVGWMEWLGLGWIARMVGG